MRNFLAYNPQWFCYSLHQEMWSEQWNNWSFRLVGYSLSQEHRNIWILSETKILLVLLYNP